MKIRIKELFLSFLIVFLVAFLGSQFTDTGTWYQSVKPNIAPPNYVFPIVWTILFFLIALSLYFSWIGAKKNQESKVVLVFGINFVLNILWSILFFGLKQPKIAFFEIMLLWLSIVWMINLSWKIDRRASYLLIPYLLWVSFAMLLNYMIMLAT